MSFDNRIFNINGVNKDHFIQALDLAFAIERKQTAAGWTFQSDKGMLLHSYNPSEKLAFNHFMGKPSVLTISNMVWEWLNDIDEDAVEHSGWDVDMDHDGHNGKGWRIYLEDWGHVGGLSGVICAVKPTYIWYGK